MVLENHIGKMEIFGKMVNSRMVICKKESYTIQKELKNTKVSWLIMIMKAKGLCFGKMETSAAMVYGKITLL